MKASNDQEFPLLSALGLYASDIRGDGKSPPSLSSQIGGKAHVLYSQATASSTRSPISSTATRTSTMPFVHVS